MRVNVCDCVYAHEYVCEYCVKVCVCLLSNVCVCVSVCFE